MKFCGYFNFAYFGQAVNCAEIFLQNVDNKHTSSMSKIQMYLGLTFIIVCLFQSVFLDVYYFQDKAEENIVKYFI